MWGHDNQAACNQPAARLSSSFATYTLTLRTSFVLVWFQVNQDLILGQVQALAAKGTNGKSLLDVGFNRIGIDDGWQVSSQSVPLV